MDSETQTTMDWSEEEAVGGDYGEFNSTFSPEEIAKRAEAILLAGKLASVEAQRAVLDFKHKREAYISGRGEMGFITINVSNVLPTPRILPAKRFRLFSMASNDLLLDVLPKQPIPFLVKFVKDFTKQSREIVRVLRCVGTMGEGKSYATFILFLQSLTKGWCNLKVCYIPDPNWMIKSPYLIIEILLLIFHDESDRSLLEYLINAYTEYHPDSQLLGKPKVTIVEVLKECFLWCSKSKKMFIVLVDQENELYSKSFAGKASTEATLYRIESGGAWRDFVSELNSGALAHFTILISSARSEPVKYTKDESIHLQHLPSFAMKSAKLVVPIFGLLEHARMVSSENLIGWREFFQNCSAIDATENENSLVNSQSWDALFDVVQTTSLNNPLETFNVLYHFSITPVAEAAAFPLKRYFSEDKELRESHIPLMKAQLQNVSDDTYRCAYRCILMCLDFHLYNSPERTKQVADALWSQLESLLRYNLPRTDVQTRHKCLYGEVREIIDERLLVFDRDQTPRSTSMLARQTILSLPASYLDSSDSSTTLDDHPAIRALSNSVPSVSGHFLEYRLLQKLKSKCFQISVITPHELSQNSENITAFKMTIIRPENLVYFHPKEIDRDLSNLIKYRNTNRNEWSVLIPMIPNFPDVDFSLLFVPSGNRPPVLFPVQVSITVGDHQESDSYFRNQERIRDDNQLMAAFRKSTDGEGRVQFLWVGNDNHDITRARRLRKFDPDSWYTLEQHWISDVSKLGMDSGTYPTRLSDIGYICGAFEQEQDSKKPRINEVADQS